MFKRLFRRMFVRSEINCNGILIVRCGQQWEELYQFPDGWRLYGGTKAIVQNEREARNWFASRA